MDFSTAYNHPYYREANDFQCHNGITSTEKEISDLWEKNIHQNDDLQSANRKRKRNIEDDCTRNPNIMPSIERSNKIWRDNGDSGDSQSGLPNNTYLCDQMDFLPCDPQKTPSTFVGITSYPIIQENIIKEQIPTETHSISTAMLDGNFDLAKLLIEKGANLGEVNEDRNTPLHLAAYKGFVKIAELLIKRGAKLGEVNNEGNTPLHLASCNGHVEIAEFLIEKGANLGEANNDGNTPLLLAAYNNQVATAEFLIEKGAKLGEVNNHGNTPLHLAAFNDYFKFAKLLIGKGANVGERNKDGNTPLHLAAYSGYAKIAELLIKRGAKLDEVNNDGETSLHFAASNGCVEIIKLLIEKGAKIGEVNKDGNTPLHLASSNGNDTIVKLLIETKIKTKIGEMDGFDERNNNGNTPLHLAAFNGHVKIAKLLIENGDSVDWLNFEGLTPLFLARNQQKMVDLLIEKGANIDYVKELIWRKCLAGGQSLDGTTTIKNIPVPLNGGFHPAKLVSLYEDFASSYQGRTRDWLESLKPQLQLQTLNNAQEILTKFATNQPLNFFVESASDHAIDVLYIGDYLLISNRGQRAIQAHSDQVQSIFVKRLDRRIAVQNQTLSVTTIDNLLEHAKTDLSFLYNELPQLSGAIEDDFICNIFKSYTQKQQKVGNCWWVSPKSMIFAMMAMSKLQSISCEGKNNAEIDQEAGEALAAAKKIYKEFSKFSKTHLFKDYLDLKMQDGESKGNAFIPPDMDLVNRVYEKLIKTYPEERQILVESFKPFENKFSDHLTSEDGLCQTDEEIDIIGSDEELDLIG